MFAAVVTGAPPTNLVSFYDELYKRTGTVQQGIIEVGQVRMGDVTRGTTTSCTRDQSAGLQRAEHQDAVHDSAGHGGRRGRLASGARVLQRRASGWGKEVILLSYPGEPHHLAKKENQKDFQDADEAVLRSLSEGHAGAEVDDGRRAADEEGRADSVVCFIEVG